MPVTDEADPETIRQSREFMATLLAPGVVVEKTGPATALPGELLTYTTDILNQGRGPALNVALTDTGPDGNKQQDDLGAVVVGGVNPYQYFHRAGRRLSGRFYRCVCLCGLL